MCKGIIPKSWRDGRSETISSRTEMCTEPQGQIQGGGSELTWRHWRFGAGDVLGDMGRQRVPPSYMCICNKLLAVKWCIFCLTGRGIYGNVSAMGHVGAWIRGYFRGVLKEQEVCDFYQIWPACQWDDGSCCKNSEYLMIKFSYNQKKR